uniref:Uncharacterized protein n=1 Tax=Globodera pallida TaxID=36090 RepID=A0A183BKS4_GLOPA
MSSSRISQVLLLAAVAYFVLLEAKIDVYVKDPHKTPPSSDDDRSNAVVDHEVNGSKKHLLLKVRGHRLVEVYRERDNKKGHKKHLLLKINTPNHRHKYVRDEIVKSRENNSAEKKVSVRVNTSREVKSRENNSAEKKVSVRVNTSREVKNRENDSAEKKVSVRVKTSREVEAHNNDD